MCIVLAVPLYIAIPTALIAFLIWLVLNIPRLQVAKRLAVVQICTAAELARPLSAPEALLDTLQSHFGGRIQEALTFIQRYTATATLRINQEMTTDLLQSLYTAGLANQTQAIGRAADEHTREKKAEEFKASIVLWGVRSEREPVGIIPCFTMRKRFEGEIKPKQLNINLIGLNSFCLGAMRRTSFPILSTFTAGLLAYLQGDFEAAVNELKMSLIHAYRDFDGLAPDIHFQDRQTRPLIHFYCGNALYYLDRLDEAIAQYAEVLKLRSDLLEAHFNLGVAYKDARKLDEAEAEFVAVLAMNSRLPDAHYSLGVVLFGQKKYEAASAELEKALELRSTFAESRYYLGRVARNLKNYERAKEEFREAIAMKPDLADAHYSLALLLHTEAGWVLDEGLHQERKRKLAAAISELQAAIAASPHFAEAYYALGRLYLERYPDQKKEWAIPQFHHAVQVKPELAEAHYQLGVFYKDEQVEEAERELKLAVHYKDDYAAAHYQLGLIYMKNKTRRKQDEAIRAFHAALRGMSKDPEVWYSLGRVYDARKELDKAQEAYLAAIRLQEDMSKAHYGLGLIYFKQRETTKALGEFQKVLRGEEGVADAKLHMFLALCYLTLEHTTQGVEELQYAIELDDTLADAHYYLGDVYHQLKRLEEAVEELRLALKGRPEEASYHHKLAQVYKEMGDRERAQREMQRALKLNPALDHTLAFPGLTARPALAESEIGNPDRGTYDSAPAEEISERIINAQESESPHSHHSLSKRVVLAEPSPSDESFVPTSFRPIQAEGFYQEAITAVQQGEHEVAARKLGDALQADPSFGPAYYEFALICKHRGRYDLAVRYFRYALASMPDDARILCGLGNIHALQRQWAEAQDAFQRAIAIDPKNAEAHFYLGTVLYKSRLRADQAYDHLEQARYHLEDAVQLNPNLLEARYQLGVIYHELGRLDKASHELEMAVELGSAQSPTLARVYSLLGDIKLKQQESTAALLCYNRALEYGLDLPNIHYALGTIYNERKDYDRAITEFDLALAAGDDAEIHCELGASYRAKKNTDLAYQHLSKAIKMYPEFSRAYYMLGNVYADKKDWEAAIHQYRMAVSFNGEMVDAYLNLGLAYVKKGEKQGARAAFAEVLRRRPGDPHAVQALEHLQSTER